MAIIWSKGGRAIGSRSTTQSCSGVPKGGFKRYRMPSSETKQDLNRDPILGRPAASETERSLQNAVDNVTTKSCGLYSLSAQELMGNWTGGFACDVHTLSSRHIGVDERGNKKWDNTRSEIGQQVYRLKYSNDFSTIPKIINFLSDKVVVEGFDCIIPVPASKIRPRQPVDAIAEALGDRISVPVLKGFLNKSGNSELKGMDDPKEREVVSKTHIKVVGPEDISGMNVLIIDDVYRSGATLRACCSILKEEEKVGEIWALTMTRTRRHR